MTIRIIEFKKKKKKKKTMSIRIIESLTMTN